MIISFWEVNFAILIWEEQTAVINARQFFYPSLLSLRYLVQFILLAVLQALTLQELSFNLRVSDHQLLGPKVYDHR